jgi:hypothetical protein
LRRSSRALTIEDCRLTIALTIVDPHLMPGIYLYCDQWCMYCPATARCLAYRCIPAASSPPDPADLLPNMADRMYESLGLVKALTTAEGRVIPERDHLFENDPQKIDALPTVDDPERMARRYAVASNRYLMSRSDFPFLMQPHADGPTPFEVFAWYHMLIAAKVYGALIGLAAAVRRNSHGATDAVACAKTALIGVDRSRTALQALAQDDEDARLDDMAAQLRRPARELEARFPDARTFVRPGLDDQ